MNTKTSYQTHFSLFVLYAICLLIAISFPLNSKAQNQPAADGEKAICKIIANNKVYTLKPNQIGNFDKVYNVSPLATVPIEVAYHNGNPGEKVIITAEDGGRLDNNKRVKIMQLDNQKKISFSFQVSGDP